MRASLVDAVGVVGGGDPATVGEPGGEADGEGLAEGAREGAGVGATLAATLGGGVGAVTVKVVVPRSCSLSSVEKLVQRTV
jgi:hypothetical protein